MESAGSTITSGCDGGGGTTTGGGVIEGAGGAITTGDGFRVLATTGVDVGMTEIASGADEVNFLIAIPQNTAAIARTTAVITKRTGLVFLTILILSP